MIKMESKLYRGFNYTLKEEDGGWVAAIDDGSIHSSSKEESRHRAIIWAEAVIDVHHAKKNKTKD
jgi:hypothetical protein